MTPKIRAIAFVLVLATVITSIAYLQSLPGAPSLNVNPNYEFSGIDSWINSKPLTMQELRGKVVLIDFWTYSCINCIRTLPYINAWNEKYSEHGLVIVGVHSPEFSFEKDLNNVKEAVKRFGIRFPVAIDNDHRTFSAFGNRYWPHKYLFDAKGNLRYDHIGEGKYEETEIQIQKLLAENGASVSGISVEPEKKYSNTTLGSAASGITRELYAIRDVVNVDGINVVGRKITYNDNGKREFDGIYLQGEWTTRNDHMLLTGDNGYLVIEYRGKTASPVIGSPSGEKFAAKVYLDDKPVPKEFAGPDLKFDQAGNSYAEISGAPRLYSLVNAKVPFGKHDLKIETSTGFAIWSVTFGG